MRKSNSVPSCHENNYYVRLLEEQILSNQMNAQNGELIYLHPNVNTQLLYNI